jgi:hypothetical protein
LPGRFPFTAQRGDYTEQEYAMSYRIDARLEQGYPSLTLIDASTGESRLYWRSDGTLGKDAAWQDLFRKLMLISCIDRIDLLQRQQSEAFGLECIQCEECLIKPGSRNDEELRLFRAYK